MGVLEQFRFFSKTTPFLRCTLCVCLLCGCGRRMSRHRKGGSSGWWRCKASPWFCFGALWAWGLALVDSELLLLITGSDWSATCAFRRHGIQEIGLPPARLGASPTCRWPHTSATPNIAFWAQSMAQIRPMATRLVANFRFDISAKKKFKCQFVKCFSSP